MSSERDQVSLFAVWVGGQLGGLRRYIDGQIAAVKASTAAAISQASTDVYNKIVGTAGPALDTLGEVQTQLANDESAVAGLVTSVGNKVAYDTSQNLTAAQQSTARTNIGALSTADLGAQVDYVAVATAAMTAATSS